VEDRGATGAGTIVSADEPRWLFATGSWLLHRRLPSRLADEADGDLRELWARRRSTGRRGLRRAYLSDLAGLVTRPRRASSPPPERRLSNGARAVLGVMGMLHDIRYALRLMRRQPLFASLTIVTLALGIAASTGIFTTVDRLLLQPLPYPEPARLMAVDEAPYTFANDRMDVHPRVLSLGVFTGAGLYAEGGLNIDALEAPVRVGATLASPGFFQAMAVQPQLGHVYTPEEDVPGANALAVISDGLWRRHFGADPEVLHRPLYVNQRAYRVVGVMPPGFTFPGRTDVWIPVFADRQATGDAFAPAVVARLSSGITREAAQAALARLDREQRERAGAPPPDPSELPTVTPLQDQLTSAVRPTLLLLAASVGLVLLVSTTNVAGLLLARVSRRHPELVIRRALGGSRWRLTRLLCIEALTFAATAGLLGVACATLALRALPTLTTDRVSTVDLTSLDMRMLAIALGLSAVTGVLFGLVPGLAAASSPAVHVMRGGQTATTGRRWRWFRNGMIVAQVAIALVLLSVTSVSIQTMRRLADIDLGFSGESVLGLEITLPMATYEGPAAVGAFADRAIERLAAVPGVTGAAATGRLPGDRSVGVGLALARPDENRPAGAPSRFATQLFASPDYFRVLGIPLIAGRAFTSADDRDAPPVAILSESAVRLLWPEGVNPVSRRITLDGRMASNRTFEVVGIAADVLLRGPNEEARPQFYRPIGQTAPFGFVSFAVQTAIEPQAVVPAIRAAVASIDPTLPVYNVQLMGDVASRFLASHRLAMTLMGAFALMTLVLAAVGLYGVLAQFVAQRTRELGIRMALGADPGRLRRGVVWLGLRLAVAGAVIGAFATGIAARLIAAFVPSLDPLTWTAIALDAGVLLTVALLAAWMPARRAAGVDVVTVLRE
jgi:predicted permease